MPLTVIALQPGNINVGIVDDVPTASNDIAQLAAGTYEPINGNVLSNDREGADSASVTDITGTPLVQYDGGYDFAIQGEYGVLEINADGSYQYTRDAGTPGGVSENFTYTLTDGDGDADNAVLTVNLANSGVTTSNLSPDSTATTITVDEDGLGLDGSSSKSATGSFTYTAPDGPVNISIGNVQIVENGVLTGNQSATGDYGNLTVTDFDETTGTLTYSYTLTAAASTDPAANDGENTVSGAEQFVVNVSDVDGDSVQGNINVGIVDDVPTASNDIAQLAAGTYEPINGNVLSNDREGADSASVTDITGTPLVQYDGGYDFAIQGEYGVLELNADGSYQYTRDAGTPGGVSENFTYTLTDGDGDADNAVLTVNLANSGVTTSNLSPDSTATTITVDEDGLGLDGSSSKSATGSFTYTAPDGPVNISIGNVQIVENGVLTGNQSATGDYGNLTVTDFDETTGTLTYSYTLTAAASTDPAANDGENTVSGAEQFVVNVSDVDGDSVQGNINVGIVDDVPTASNDIAQLAAGTYEPINGNVLSNDREGADSASVTDITGTPLVQYDGGYDFAIQGEYGVLELNADGSYQYTRDAGTPGGVSENFTYTLTDGDGDADNAVLTVNLANSGVTTSNLSPDSTATTITVDEDGLGLDGSSSKSATGSFTYTAPDGPVNISIGNVQIVENGVLTGNQSATGDYGNLTVTDFDETTGTLTYSYTLTAAASTDPAANDGENTVSGAEQFVVNVSDVDGDSVQGNINVGIVDDVPTASNDIAQLAAGTYEPINGNVLSNDREGADSASVTDITGTPLVEYDGGYDFAIQGEYGVLELNADGSYQYTRDAGTPGGVSENFTYTLTDGDGDADNAVLTMTIDSDAPTALDDSVSVESGGLQYAQFIVDLSGSIVHFSPLPELKSGLNSALDHLETNGVIAVQVVAFAKSAALVGEDGTLTIQQAREWVSSLTKSSLKSDNLGDLTYYDKAAQVAEDAWLAHRPDGANAKNSISVFISDGKPNSGRQLTYDDNQTGGSRGDWEEFVSNNFTQSVAVGLGDNTESKDLGVIAHNPDGSDLILTAEDTSNFGSVLVSALSLTGNILSNDSSGNDGWGNPSMVSLEYDGVTYHAGDTILTASGEITIEDDGTYVFIPITIGAESSPEKQLQAQGDVTSEITYTVQDADGTQDTAVFSITVTEASVSIGGGTGNYTGQIWSIKDGKYEDYEQWKPTATSPNLGLIVDEADLYDGNDDKTSTNSFTYTGLNADEPVNIDIANIRVIENGVLTGNQPAAGHYGTLTITNFDPSSNTLTYRYTLTSPAKTESITSDGKNIVRDEKAFSIALYDADGTDIKVEADINISIVDDVPTASNDVHNLAPGSDDPVSGNVLSNDREGADGASVTAITGASIDGSYVVNSLLRLASSIDGQHLDTLSYTLSDLASTIKNTQTGSHPSTIGDSLSDLASSIRSTGNTDDPLYLSVLSNTLSNLATTAGLALAGGYNGDYDFAVRGQYGVLELNEDGSYRYSRNGYNTGDGERPGGGYAGDSDSFTYTITDGDNDSDTAELTFHFSQVNPHPINLHSVNTGDTNLSLEPITSLGVENIPLTYSQSSIAENGDVIIRDQFDVISTDDSITTVENTSFIVEAADLISSDDDVVVLPVSEGGATTSDKASSPGGGVEESPQFSHSDFDTAVLEADLLITTHQTKIDDLH